MAGILAAVWLWLQTLTPQPVDSITDKEIDLRHRWMTGRLIEGCETTLFRLRHPEAWVVDFKTPEHRTEKVPLNQSGGFRQLLDVRAVARAHHEWEVSWPGHRFVHRYTKGAMNTVPWNPVAGLAMSATAVAWVDGDQLRVRRQGSGEMRAVPLLDLDDDEVWAHPRWTPAGVAIRIFRKADGSGVHDGWRDVWLWRNDVDNAGAPIADGGTTPATAKGLQPLYDVEGERHGWTGVRPTTGLVFVDAQGQETQLPNHELPADASVVHGHVMVHSKHRASLRLKNGSWHHIPLDKGIWASPTHEGFAIIDLARGVDVVEEGGRRQLLRFVEGVSFEGQPLPMHTKRQRLRAVFLDDRVVLVERLRDAMCRLQDNVYAVDLKTGALSKLSGDGDKARYLLHSVIDGVTWTEADVEYHQLHLDDMPAPEKPQNP